MSNGYNFFCANCNYEVELQRDDGFMLHGLPIEKYLDHPFIKFHPSTHQKILSLASKIKGLQIYSTHKGYRCPQCNIAYAKLYVEVFKGGRTFHQSYFRCNLCNKELEEHKISPTHIYRCPKCLHEKLTTARLK
jgi:DNA-directed RNA polymerase subunit RPC12/RpoP